MTKALRSAGYALLAMLGLLLIWESCALWRAKQRTAEVLREANAGELRLADLDPRRKAMLLKVEDPGFYAHKGVDYSTAGQGATTLTQGLVKRFYFDGGFKPGFAKIEQSLIARFVFDPALSKDKQLQAYLNHAYLGRAAGGAVIGYAAGARAYFNREFRELTDEQFLSLLAMTIAPNELDPVQHAAANRERVRRIQRLLQGSCAPSGLGDVRYDACT